MRKQHETAVLVISDLHIGKKTADFNITVARRRLNKLAEKVCRIKEQLGNGYELDNIHVWMLGDTIDGDGIYPGQPHHQDESNVTEQTFIALLQLDSKYSAADRVLYELAWAQKSQQKTEDSLVSFRKLVAEHPGSSMAAESHFHLAEASYEKKSYKLAIDAYLAAQNARADSDLAEQVAVITGAAQGLGLAITEKLASCGASVVIGDLQEEILFTVASTIVLSSSMINIRRADRISKIRKISETDNSSATGIKKNCNH